VDYLTRTGETSPADGQTAESVYDPSGRRIEKKFDGQTQV
jgi:YD repeat-containing protein